MRVLWLCNIMLPAAAKALGLKASNKEGWLSGICNTVSCKKEFELHICFPTNLENDGFTLSDNGISYYGFYEDTAHPESYDEGLEPRLKKIVDIVNPDVIHIFGTEYPHTLAMCRVCEAMAPRILIGIQGVMTECAPLYMNGVPKRVINRPNFRDIVRHDTLMLQQKKFYLRSHNEQKAVAIAGNITGRTPYDRAFHDKYSPDSSYYHMNETLRPVFYEGSWDYEKAQKHSIFLSQANYPLKGAHYVFRALPGIIKKFPDTKVYIAGDDITKHETLKDKIKLSSYGLYLLELIRQNKLSEHVFFLGSLKASDIKEQLLKANVFACTSSTENSPNSLGEAMLLGVPCVTADVGGIRGIFDATRDGLMYHETETEKIVQAIEDCIEKMFTDTDFATECGKRAAEHASVTHHPDINYKRLVEIYTEISKK